jgi:MoxR-like ATPase
MIKKLKTEIQKVIIGQEDLVDHLLIGLITGGHILVESVPGLAKTTAINTVSKALGIQFKRIQFTPDLLPSDLTGAQTAGEYPLYPLYLPLAQPAQNH